MIRWRIQTSRVESITRIIIIAVFPERIFVSFSRTTSKIRLPGPGGAKSRFCLCLVSYISALHHRSGHLFVRVAGQRTRHKKQGKISTRDSRLENKARISNGLARIYVSRLEIVICDRDQLICIYSRLLLGAFSNKGRGLTRFVLPFSGFSADGAQRAGSKKTQRRSKIDDTITRAFSSAAEPAEYWRSWGAGRRADAPARSEPSSNERVFFAHFLLFQILMFVLIYFVYYLLPTFLFIYLFMRIQEVVARRYKLQRIIEEKTDAKMSQKKQRIRRSPN